MTEKRFTITNSSLFYDEDKPLSTKVAVDLLNHFNDENKVLKQEYQEMRILLTKIEREFRERGILTEEEFMRLLE